jgi:hypothetical protein
MVLQANEDSINQMAKMLTSLITLAACYEI